MPVLDDIVAVPEIPIDPQDTELLQLVILDANTAAAEVRRTSPDFRAGYKDIREVFLDELEAFVETRPDSAWTPSLRCNLGLYYRRIGRQTLALIHWEETWMALNESNHPVTKKTADTAFAQWTSLLASLGRVEELTVLMEATRGRDFGKGSIRHLMNQTLEGSGRWWRTQEVPIGADRSRWPM